MGAAAAAAPLIYSISAPPPALAATLCGTGSLGCQGFTVTSATNVCPSHNCGAHNCACCFTTVHCIQPGGSANGAWTTCLSACTTCTNNAAGYEVISAACANYPSPVPINTSCSGHETKAHCVG